MNFEVVGDKIILLFIYDKTEMENVQTAFIEQILQQYLLDSGSSNDQYKNAET